MTPSAPERDDALSRLLSGSEVVYTAKSRMTLPERTRRTTLETGTLRSCASFVRKSA